MKYRKITDIARYMNTMLFPKVARYYDTLASTNAEAIRAINEGEGPEAGAVFWTEEQSEGRGQGTNRWHASPAANLTISIVAYPDHLPVDRLFALTQLTGLAVAATVRHFAPERAAEVSLKWPNDVYVCDQKIAGILVQNGLRGSAVSWSVLGIGLNVNETNFPPELTESATSLQLLTGSTLDREAVAHRLFDEITTYYSLTSPAGLTVLDAAYHEMLYRLGVPARFRQRSTGDVFRGIIQGVNESGQLLMNTERASEECFSLREIAFLR